MGVLDSMLVVVPLHEYNEEVKGLLEKALKSVPSNYAIVISTTNELNEKYNTELVNILGVGDGAQRTILCGDNTKSDFCTLVNNAVNTDYKWFSILEYDDEYTDIWFRNAEKFMEFKADASVFLPLTELVDGENGRFVSYGNEAPWASSFSNEIGFIDYDCLGEFFDFYLTGSIFNTQDWVNCGGLKPSIKLTFWYEFLLRLTNSGKKAYVVPKLGYKHTVNRVGSLYDIYNQTIDSKEAEWWYKTAKEECFYTQDRNKIYTENNNAEGE